MNPSSPTSAGFRRWLDNFVALPDRLRLPLAMVGALLFHGLVVFCVWVWPFLLAALLSVSLLPAGCVPKSAVTAPPPAAPAPLEVVIEPPPPDPEPTEPAPLTPVEEAQLAALFEELPEEVQRDYLDVEGLAKKKNLSKRALLESWQDSVAGSRRPGKGTSPLPTQDGRTDLPFTNFKNQRAVVGDPRKPPAVEEQPREKPLVVPGADLSPLYQPKPANAQTPPTPPEPPKETVRTPPPPPAQAEPKSTASAKPAPPDLPQVVEAKPDEIALFVRSAELTSKLPDAEPIPTPQSTPPPVVEPEPEPVLALRPTPVPMPKPAKPVVAPPPAPLPENTIVAHRNAQSSRPTPIPNAGYTPHMEQRKIDGGNAPGEDGVDAVATNRGRYMKTINQIVGSRWTYYMRDARQSSLLTAGQVTVRFRISSKGKLMQVRVVENTSNAAHAALCQRAFLESEGDFEAPPPELLRQGVFEDNFNFLAY